MHILLTGSSGWLGRYLAPRLRKIGHQVTGLDVAPGVDTHIIGSVADRSIVDKAFARGIDAVIHSGALHKPDIVRYPAQSFVDVNITGTLNLLEAAKAAKHDRFVFTSTTSLMISQDTRSESADHAIWLDETTAPLQPRNIYGVTKYAAEQLCRLYAEAHGVPSVVLRTSRFFPEDDDSLTQPAGDNLKANELLYRRLTVEDAADAHIAALNKTHDIGFGRYIISAPTPFARHDVAELKRDAASVVAKYFPKAAALYAARGWHLPTHIGRVYDASLAERELGFRAESDFASVLNALGKRAPLPFVHDPSYTSPTKGKPDWD
jgi:UDP-glucose 4-epimerase